MKKVVMSLDELTPETVSKLSEEDVSGLLNKITSDLPKERRSEYVNIINTAFEFRSISAKSRSLKGDLAIYGFKFFPIPFNDKVLMGIKGKSGCK